jgi:hypothetical protein
MLSLAQIIESNRTHSEHAYPMLCELILPDGTSVRLARNTESIAWPNAGSASGVLAAAGESVSVLCAEAGSIEIALTGDFAGAIALEHDDGAGGNWTEIAAFTGPSGGEYLCLAGRTYRLIVRSLTEGAPHALIAPKGTVWTAFNFLPDDIEESGNVETRGVTVRVGNASQAMYNYMRQLMDWRKLHGPELIQVRLCVVNTGLLDEPEPEAEYWFVDEDISCPQPMQTVEIKLGLENIWDRPVPRRSITRDFCQWDAAEDCPYYAVCNHTLTACRTTYANTLNFGGFPTVEQGGVNA